MKIRRYEHDKDFEAACQIWRDTGWLDSDDTGTMESLIAMKPPFVAEVDSRAECMVISAVGRMRYCDEQVQLSGVTGVTTSLLARRIGAAARATAALLNSDMRDGAAVAGLGAFDLGFYNKLGFGSTTPLVMYTFDPALIRVDSSPRTPVRLTPAMADDVHAGRLARRAWHGNCSFDNPGTTTCEMRFGSKSFGLGFRDELTGELTHHIWCKPDNIEHGPWRIPWMAWSTKDQFMELMALLRDLSDQVQLVRLEQPPGMSLWDVLDRPLRAMSVRRDGKFAMNCRSVPYFQFRILDLAVCIAAAHLRCSTLQFNLELTDPIERYLPSDAKWRGLHGCWRLTLGAESSAARGSNSTHQTLRASVSAFTRLWLGSHSASSLAITDELAGPPELLKALDSAFALPPFSPDWDF